MTLPPILFGSSDRSLAFDCTGLQVRLILLSSGVREPLPVAARLWGVPGCVPGEVVLPPSATVRALEAADQPLWFPAASRACTWNW